MKYFGKNGQIIAFHIHMWSWRPDLGEILDPPLVASSILKYAAQKLGVRTHLKFDKAEPIFASFSQSSAQDISPLYPFEAVLWKFPTRKFGLLETDPNPKNGNFQPESSVNWKQTPTLKYVGQGNFLRII